MALFIFKWRPFKECAVAAGLAIGSALALALMPLPVTAAPQLVDQFQLRQVAYSKSQQHWQQRFAEAKTSPTQLRQLMEEAREQSLGDIEREQRLHAIARQLRQMAKGDDTQAIAAELSTYQSQIWVRMPEADHASEVPAYPIAAAAKGAQRVWQRNAIQLAAAEALLQGNLWSQLPQWDLTDRFVFAGVETALQQASEQALKDFAMTLQQAPQEYPRLSFITALLLQDQSLMQQLVSHASSGQLVKQLLTLPDPWPADAALPVLYTALHNPVLQDVALAAFAAPSLSAHQSQIKPRLWPLAQQGNTSAAALLGRWLTDEDLTQLNRWLAADENTIQHRMALYMLSQSELASAEARLRDYLANPSRSNQLKNEVRQWL